MLQDLDVINFEKSDIMRVALVNENSQKNKNKIIFHILEKVANEYGHEVFNYGVKEDDDYSLDYVDCGVLIGIY